MFSELVNKNENISLSHITHFSQLVEPAKLENIFLSLVEVIQTLFVPRV